MSSWLQEDPKHTSCLLCGAGAAGMSAALWLHDYNIPFIWITSGGQLGGMLHRVNNTMHNVLGHTYAHGHAFIAAMHTQLQATPGLQVPQDHTLLGVRSCGSMLHASLTNDTQILTDSIILATGTRYKTLRVQGISSIKDHFISPSATRDGHLFAGLDVAIVGGGDAAFENAIILAEQHKCTVHMIMRSQPKARTSFVERAQAHPLIHGLDLPHRIISSVAQDGATHIVLHLRDTWTKESILRLHGLFVKIGIEPMLPSLEPKPALDPQGYILVDANQRTSIPQVFAAGDVTAHPLRSVITSAGAGAKAAFSTAHHLGIFSIQGEGADHF